MLINFLDEFIGIRSVQQPPLHLASQLAGMRPYVGFGNEDLLSRQFSK